MKIRPRPFNMFYMLFPKIKVLALQQIYDIITIRI